MLKYTVSLLSYFSSESPVYYDVESYDFDLGLEVGDPIFINIMFQDKIYNIKSTVMIREKTVFTNAIRSTDERIGNFQIKVFCEAEDKTLVSEFGQNFAAEWNAIRKEEILYSQFENLE